MSQRLSERYLGLRKEAVVRAAQELERCGFTREGDRLWAGPISISGRPALRIRVELPLQFPDTLPSIFLNEASDSSVRAHVGSDGKVCIAPDTGVLLDTDRPERIVLDGLDRAKQVLFQSDELTQRLEVESEFTAYWAEPPGVLTICDPTVESRPIVLAEVARSGAEGFLLAPTADSVRRWTAATRATANWVRGAYFVRLDSLFTPPRLGHAITLRDLLSLVKTHSEASVHANLSQWLEAHGLPSSLLLSGPSTDRSSYVVFAALIPAGPVPKGFRPGKVPPKVQVGAARILPVKRLGVERADPPYALTRGGGLPDLINRRVVVIGCGSVGSYACASLASCGVGNLQLLDHETLESANIHRHLLGAIDLGRNKAEALADRLQERFPLTQIQAVPRRIEDVLEVDPDTLVGAHLVLVALGDETLELRLNDYFGLEFPRVHVSLEPLGLGGRVVTVGVGARQGCLECLYRRDDEFGLVCMASLCAPGQRFQRTLGGCRGTFTPYGAVDAERAAIEAVRQVISALTDTGCRPAIISWVVSTTSFTTAGYKLSSRGEALRPGSTQVLEEFARPDCRVCSRSRS